MKRFLGLGFVLAIGAGLQASTDWSAYLDLVQDFDKNASQIQLKLEQASVGAANDLANVAIVELLASKLDFAYQDLINAKFEHKERFLREQLDKVSALPIVDTPDVLTSSLPDSTKPRLALSTRNLSHSVYIDNITQVKDLLAQGPYAGMLDEHHLLHWAKSPKMANLLIEHGAHLETLGEEGKTALHEVRNAQMVNFFVDHGIDVNTKDNRGMTPLHRAVNNGLDNTDIVKALLARGASVNVVDNMGQTPLHVAAWQGVTDDTVKVLLDAGANVDALNSVGQSPMDIATNTDNNAMVSLMIPKQGPKSKASQPGYLVRLYNYFTSK